MLLQNMDECIDVYLCLNRSRTYNNGVVCKNLQSEEGGQAGAGKAKCERVCVLVCVCVCVCVCC